MPDLRHEDFRRLLEFRTALRTFLRFSEEAAAEAGLTPAQHQLLLAVRGHDDPRGPTIGNVAGTLLLRHHSAVELIDRSETAGFIRRTRDPQDHRVVRLQLTKVGAQRLHRLAAAHLEELSHLAPKLGALHLDLGSRA